MITSGKSSSGMVWPYATVVQDLSRLLNPEVVVSSKDRAFLYAALNFREPVLVSDMSIRRRLVRRQTLDTSGILYRNICRLRQKSHSPLPKVV